MWQKKKTLLLAWLGIMPAFAWALTPLEDNQLANVTGQDGVTITVEAPSLSWDQTIYDRDGVPADGNGKASVLGIPTSLDPGKGGAIIMKGIGLTLGGPMTITADAGQSTAGDPVLNINVAIADGTEINLPDLQLARPVTPGGWKLDSGTTRTIFSAGTTSNPGITLALGATNMNLQLGNVAQDLVIDSTTYKPLLLTDLSIKNGVHIKNMTIKDVSNPASSTYDACGTLAVQDCAMKVDNIYVNDNDGPLASTKGTSNLTVKGLGMNISSSGLAFAVDQVGYRDGSNVDHGINVQMENVHLGGANVPGMGNTYIKGLQLGSDAVLTVSGH